MDDMDRSKFVEGFFPVIDMDLIHGENGLRRRNARSELSSTTLSEAGSKGFASLMADNLGITRTGFFSHIASQSCSCESRCILRS